MRTHVATAAALALAAATALLAQTPSAPAALVTFSGRVLTADGHQPVANARIVVPRTSPDRPFVFTDDEGRFTVSAPANSSLTVSKAGYNTQSLSGRGGALPDAFLLQSAGLSGRVVATNGEPITGARLTVELLRDATSGPNATPSALVDTVLGTTTNDRGEYRIAPAPLQPFRLRMEMVTGIETRGGPNGVYYSNPAIARVYFPGVTESADAQIFQLTPAYEQSAVDFVTPPQPASDSFRPVPSPPLVRGTGTLSGRVISSDGAPLEDVVVSLGGPGNTSLTATSRANGIFEFRDLPAGTLRVVGEKRGYFNTASAASQSVAGRQRNNVGIELAAGERRDGLVLQLQRMLSLSGRILDEHSEPLRGTWVQALELRFVSGRRQLVPAGRAALSDDRGAYRLSALAPGNYIVSATTGGVSSPGIGGYATTYYPAANQPAQADWIALTPSADADGVDLVMARAPTVTISGQMFAASGLPTGGGRLELLKRTRTSIVASSVGARISPDGRFEFPNVAPGEYVIQAGNGRKDAATEGEFAALPISVGSTDVSGVMLRLSRGSDISAQVTYDGRPAPVAPSGFPLELTTAPSDPDLAPQALASARIGRNERLIIRGLSGPRRLVVRNLPDGWAVQAIRAGGIDVTDAVIAFGEPNQSLNDVEIALTSRITTLSGTVSDDRLAPAEGVPVIVFPLDRSLWIPASRFVRRITARNGRFAVAGLPGGSYYVATAPVLPPLGPDAWQDPDYLDSLIAGSTAITLSEGQESTTTLRLRSR